LRLLLLWLLVYPVAANAAAACTFAAAGTVVAAGAAIMAAVDVAAAYEAADRAAAWAAADGLRAARHFSFHITCRLLSFSLLLF
jgi:hypothetical protein